MLAVDAPRFVGLQLGAGDQGATFGVLAVFSLVMTLMNFGLGRWFDAPAPLGPLQVIGAAGVGTFAWVVARAMLDPARRIAPAIDRRVLAAAVERELEVARTDRAEVETLACTATRAWASFVDGEARLLVLECDASSWLALRGPLIASRVGDEVGQRIDIERLRWTNAMLSLTIGGTPIPVTRIELADERGAPECELWAEHELPPAIAAAIGHAATAYR
jgi:hypothetical protein